MTDEDRIRQEAQLVPLNLQPATSWTAKQINERPERWNDLVRSARIGGMPSSHLTRVKPSSRSYPARGGAIKGPGKKRCFACSYRPAVSVWPKRSAIAGGRIDRGVGSKISIAISA